MFVRVAVLNFRLFSKVKLQCSGHQIGRYQGRTETPMPKTPNPVLSTDYALIGILAGAPTLAEPRRIQPNACDPIMNLRKALGIYVFHVMFLISNRSVHFWALLYTCLSEQKIVNEMHFIGIRRRIDKGLYCWNAFKVILQLWPSVQSCSCELIVCTIWILFF